MNGLRSVSDIITDILEAEEPEVAPSARHAIKGDSYKPWCNCPDCMRAYLKSVEGKGDAA